jgi:hypothetical protein
MGHPVNHAKSNQRLNSRKDKKQTLLEKLPNSSKKLRKEGKREEILKNEITEDF